jgi:hypothetical protein
MLLILGMLVGMLPISVLAADSDSPFTDVRKSDWFYNEVQYVYEHGLMEGTASGLFRPSVTTSRGMLVTILWRLEGQPTVSGTVFADVASGQWYTDAIQWASANGIVDGYGNGKFGPNDPLTREQMATILYRYASYKGYDVAASASLSKYTDAGKVSSYAAAAMSWANAAGLITGMTDTTLAPQGSATRAQAATILMRFCGNVVSKTEDDLKALLANATTDKVTSWIYDDFDGNGIYEAYALTYPSNQANVWFISSAGAELIMNAGNAGWYSATPLVAGKHKFMVLIQYEPVPTMYYAKHYLFTVKDGGSYQPTVSGENGYFGHNAQADYNQLAQDQNMYGVPVTDDAFYSCTWCAYGADPVGRVPWTNIVYYDFDENLLEFVPRSK